MTTPAGSDASPPQRSPDRGVTDPSRLRPTAASGTSVAWRAGLALALLLGYFVLVVAVVGGLGYLTVQAFASGGSGVVSTKLAILTGVVALAIGRAVFAVEHRGDDEPEDGLLVSRHEQPELWALVDEVSRELGVAAPDDLRLVDDVNAFVHQDTRLLGLVGGARHMGIGVALLQVLTVDQLRAVVAHELGHYAGGDTRLSALVYRASATIQRTVAHLGPDSLLGRLFALYARLYQRVSLAVRRRQELRADEGSVRVAGQQVHESALREAQAGSAAWAFFADSYVVPLWRAARLRTTCTPASGRCSTTRCARGRSMRSGATTGRCRRPTTRTRHWPRGWRTCGSCPTDRRPVTTARRACCSGRRTTSSGRSPSW